MGRPGSSRGDCGAGIVQSCQRPPRGTRRPTDNGSQNRTCRTPSTSWSVTTTGRCGHVLAVRQPQQPPLRNISTNSRATIRIHGWAVQGVEDDRLPSRLHDRATRPRPTGYCGGDRPVAGGCGRLVLNDVAGAAMAGRATSLCRGWAHRLLRRRAAARDRRGGSSRCAHEFRCGARRPGHSGTAVGVGRRAWPVAMGRRVGNKGDGANRCWGARHRPAQNA